MATVNNSSLQGASGKIDGHVAYTVGNKTYLRKLAVSISNPRTEKQAAQRVKLTAAQTMYRAIRGSLLEKVHAIAAKEEERRSGYHGFLHANMNMFGQDDYIDYPRLVISTGSLQLPFGTKATRCTPEELELAWLDNSSTVTAQPSDRLLVAAIFNTEPYQPEVLETNVFCRQNGQASVLLPEGEWETAHLYCFFSAENRKRFSPCMYFTVSKL